LESQLKRKNWLGKSDKFSDIAAGSAGRASQNLIRQIQWWACRARVLTGGDNTAVRDSALLAVQGAGGE
jgi:hypothetical protein